MSQPRKALHVRHVAFTFFGTYLFVAIVLSYWYAPTVLLQDPLICFAWAGTAYLVAYAVTEFVRKPGFFNFLGLPGALLLLAFDFARHASLIAQLTAPHGLPILNRYPWAQFESCAASGSVTFPCSVGVPLSNNPAMVLGVVAGLLIVPMIYKLLIQRNL
jgi:hypothetical protein